MKALKVLHLVSDEKFIDIAIKQFSTLKNLSNSYLLRYSINKELTHIKSKRVISFSNRLAIYKYILNNDFDIVIYHCMYLDPVLFILAKAKGKKIVWLSWGADLYVDIDSTYSDIFPLKLDLYKSETRKWISNNNRTKISLNYLKHIIFYKYLLFKVDFLSTVLPIEFDLVNDAFKRKFKPFFFDYFDFTVDLKTEVKKFTSKETVNVLVGNSATPTNNHIDIFKKLSALELGSRKIIVPLSYGDFKYREHVLHAGKQLLGENFYPLIDFMPLDKYHEILSSCGYVIIGCMRQQAMGNVDFALLNEKKLFLYKESLIYKGLIKNDFILFTINDMSSSDFMGNSSESYVVNTLEMLSKYDLTSYFSKFKNNFRNLHS